MVRIFVTTEKNELISQYSKICERNNYAFNFSSDAKIIESMISAETPDIILIDDSTPTIDTKSLVKTIKQICETSILILITENNDIDKDLLKTINAIIPTQYSESLIEATISINLRMKGSLQKLSNTNKDLASSLYRLNTLYNTSSQFAGTLDKEKLFEYMIDGLDKSLSFSLTSTLSFCDSTNPVLILHSLYDVSEELLDAIKVRAIYNYKSIFDGKDLPYEVTAESLKVIKNIKHPSNKYNFTLFQFDNMFSPIALGENFYGCIEIFKENHFTSDDAKCFQSITQQVTLPLKSATLYQEIIETNKKLEQLERLKSEFISIVSHELRTPLTSIKNSLDILHSGKCGEISPASDKFLTMAKKNVTRLAGIINDLLDLSKIEAGKMDFHFNPIQIKNVIEDVRTALAGLAKEKSIEILTENNIDLPEVMADSQRLEQVLTNLLSNAIKFTPDNKSITIRTQLLNATEITYHPSFANDLKSLHGDYIVVSVEDQGIGIAEDELLHAFDKFAQIENSLSRKVGGTGLGLPIAKQLLEAHKGAIWCDSALEKGSKFHFAIPVDSARVKELV